MFDPFLTEKQILRKLGGDKNPGKVITFDGNLSGKETFEIEPGMFFVKLSDDVYDINNVESITISDFDGEKTLQKDAFTFVYDGSIPAIALGGVPCVTVIPEDGHEGLPRGLFVFYMTENGFSVYPSKIQLAETIVPIDQKYLGGVCLPVVELSLEFMEELSEVTGSMACPDKIATALDAAKALCSPCIFRLIDPVSDVFFAHVSSATVHSSTGYLIYDAGTMVDIRFGFVCVDGAWIVSKGG